jgi:adenine-specific DNA-methyltransferase
MNPGPGKRRRGVEMAKKKKIEPQVGGGKAESYKHPTADSPMRPEVGTQPQFKKKKPPKTYRYDSSLSPQLDWDTNPAREYGEALIGKILNAKSIEEAKHAASQLKAMSQPFLNWTGKAERLSFDVPTLPLFIHERLSTKAIIETIRDRKRQGELFDLLHQEQKRPATEQVLKAYEHRDKWVNRMILGDSLVVMNSLLDYEGLAGKVQMIYMDPPYGINYGSNFQPFIKKRDVKHNDDDHITREPEMVQAYRDTWELGAHSYLTYLKDRVLLSRELLADTGSIFIQISDANLHHVRELLDEVYGPNNFQAIIAFKTSSPLGSKGLAQSYDFIIWYAKNSEKMKFRPLFKERDITSDKEWRFIDDPETELGYRKLSDEEFRSLKSYKGIFRRRKLESSGFTESCTFTFNLNGKQCKPFGGKSWATNKNGIEVLKSKSRLFLLGNSPYFKQYFSDFPYQNIDNCWNDQPSAEARVYVVQTATKFIQRCMLMTTDPGDLVIDPTCGSGSTALVAESWGRRWITIDTSRVPLALARQRLLCSSYPYYQLKNETLGPAGGFVYERMANKYGEEVGGVIPHLTLGSIANNETPEEEIVVDKPGQVKAITRVTGPFVFEATIPTPVDYGNDGEEASKATIVEEYESFTDRMLEILRRSPSLHLEGNKEIKLKDLRRPTKTLALSAEAISINGKDRRVALLFGPESGAVSHQAVYSAIQEAHMKGYEQLIVIGFAIEPNARMTIDQCEEAVGISAIYVQATPDLMMGDLLKTMRSSQIFSVCGLPEFHIKKSKSKQKDTPETFQVFLEGLDTFDPTTMEVVSRKGDDVPAWFLDTDYNGLVFHVDQAFFPKTGAWESLKKALKGIYDESTWDHLAGADSAPFEAGEQKQVAVKVIDERGNELIAVKSLKEALQ